MQRFLIISVFAFLLSIFQAKAQHSLFEGLSTRYEMQMSISDNQTPLWLNANRYGVSSLTNTNGYVRVGLSNDSALDQKNIWRLGYGLDIIGAYHHTTNAFVQQLYADLSYRWFTLSIGSKQRAMEMKNNMLSSGSQTLGINAHPIPQVRIGIEEYKSLSFTNDWLSIKGHISYGFMSDGKWQKKYTNDESKWSDRTLYHSKAGYIRIGKESRPLCFELGLEMATIFGGTVHWIDGDGKPTIFNGGKGVSSFWNAFIPGGSDFQEAEQGYINVEGDQLGSWVTRLSYKTQCYDVSVYADHFFEDHSALYHLGYYGYGKDGDWQKRSRKLYLYPLKDGLIGTEITLKKQTRLKNVVLEFINTRFQSGPIYHDHTATVLDQIAGQDNYYNHTYYPGWQYYGQVIGNPLYLSPINNNDGDLEIKDNRFFAWHLGFLGDISKTLSYRMLASWQKGFGTYRTPYSMPKENIGLMAEVKYDCSKKVKGLHLCAAYGFDKGKLIGNNNGFQMSIIYER